MSEPDNPIGALIDHILKQANEGDAHLAEAIAWLLEQARELATKLRSEILTMRGHG